MAMNLQQIVHEALDNAKENEYFEKGGDLYGLNAIAIAIDLQRYCSDCENYSVGQLTSHVETWLSKQAA